MTAKSVKCQQATLGHAICRRRYASSVHDYLRLYEPRRPFVLRTRLDSVTAPIRHFPAPLKFGHPLWSLADPLPDGDLGHSLPLDRWLKLLAVPQRQGDNHEQAGRQVGAEIALKD
jgi:hypothetical protein